MATRINDLREQLVTLDDAKQLFADIAADTVDLAVKDARVEKRISAMKQGHAEETAEQRRRLAHNEQRLRDFISANRHLFKAPRKVRTSHGTFGLQKVTEVIIHDEPTLLKALMDGQHEDCLKQTVKPVKTGIQALFEQGILVPGCHLISGDTAVYTVSRVLVNTAVQESIQ